MVEIINATKGKTRDLPVSAEALRRMQHAAELIDPGLSIEITSGGQAPKGTSGKRTGSTRHDVDHTGHSHTADVVLVRNGRKVLPGEDRELYARYLKNAAALGFTGLGHYGWGIHVGNGSRAAWGPSTGGGDLDPYFGTAIREGWANPIRFDGRSSTEQLAQAQNAGADTSVERKGLPPVLDEVIAAAQNGYDDRKNPLSPGNTPVENPYPNEGPIRIAEPSPPLKDLFKAAVNVESDTAWAIRRSSDYVRDPNWTLPNERLSADLDALGDKDGRYVSVLSRSFSEGEYQENIAIAKQQQVYEQQLADAGYTGMALRFGVAMFDPLGWGTDAALGAAVPMIGGASRMNRLRRALTAGAAGAASGAATGAIGAAVNPHKDNTDIIYGTVFGFGMGGVAGSLARRSATRDEAAALQMVALAARKEIDGELPAVNVGNSAGAARAHAEVKFLSDEALEFVGDDEIAKSAFLNGRLDLFAEMDKSPNTLTRIAAGLVNDGTGKLDGAINGISASEEQVRYFNSWATPYMKTYKPALNEFRSRHSKGWLDRAEVEGEFNDQISRYICDRAPGRSERYDPAVVRVGNRMADLFKDSLQTAQNPFIREGRTGGGLTGWEEIPPDQHYMPRLWAADRIIQKNRIYRDGFFHDLLAGAIRSEQPRLEERLIKSLARGMSTAILRRAHGLEDEAFRAMGGDNIDRLIAVLKTDGGLTDEDAAEITHFLNKKSDAGVDARAKHRVLLDENFRLRNIMRRDGTVDEEGIGILDLINMDASTTFLSYIRHVSGAVALGRFRFKDPKTGEVLIDGFKSDAEFAKFKKRLMDRGAELQSKGVQEQKHVEKDIKNLNLAYNSIRGRPVNDLENTDFGWWSRAIRKMNYSRILNQVGFAQISEIGVVVGTLGIKASMSQVPALRRMLNQSGETVLESGLADALETWIGIGTERLLHRNNYQLDEMTGVAEASAGRWRDKVDRGLNAMNNVTSEISGQRQADIMTRRWAGASIVQKFADMAAGGKGLSAARLADLGLDEDMAQRIVKMLNEPGNMEFRKGFITGRKVTDAKFENWVDKEAREAFLAAVLRLSDQIIQRNDIGNLIPWMSHPAAKMLMQFRTFMVGAYPRQTLKSLHFRDMPALGSAMGAVAMAGAAYIARTKVQAIGRSDREEWEDKRLAWGEIGAASLARAGMSSIIPMLVDTGLYAADQEAWFSRVRSTEQVSDLVWGNPVFSGYGDAVQAARSMAGLLDDREWSQEEARALQRILPFGNAVPIMIALNGMIHDLPEYKPREDRGGR